VKYATFLLSLALPLAAATVGQIDNFENGTTNNWFAGGGPFGQVPPNPPVNVATGGPGGIDDAYLKLTSGGGNGPGSRLVALNAGQWGGSFAGISGITAQFINLGNSDLTIRLYLEDPIPGPPANEAVTEGVFLPAGSGWTNAFFSLDPATLTVIQGDVNTLLGHTTVLRIIHSTTASVAEPVAGVLGVDNIQAVPEPGTIAVLLPALAGLLWASRRRAA
jgi:hypothetical protein